MMQITAYLNPVPREPYLDENDRIAREVARDAYRATISCLLELEREDAGIDTARAFGVQHVGGRVRLSLEVKCIT